MKIPKLLKDEIQLYRTNEDILIYIEVGEGYIINETLYLEGVKCEFNFDQDLAVKDCIININNKKETIISINPKYKKYLLSKDNTIVNMTIDIILEDAKDFIDEYLKKFK